MSVSIDCMGRVSLINTQFLLKYVLAQVPCHVARKHFCKIDSICTSFIWQGHPPIFPHTPFTVTDFGAGTSLPEFLSLLHNRSTYLDSWPAFAMEAWKWKHDHGGSYSPEWMESLDYLLLSPVKIDIWMERVLEGLSQDLGSLDYHSS